MTSGAGIRCGRSSPSSTAHVCSRIARSRASVPAEVGALATAVHGDTLAAEVLLDIAARSDGIPFYVEELASFSGERLPISLRDVLLLRYERLDAEARRFARVLATGGVEVADPVLRAVFEGEESALEAAVRSAGRRAGRA